MKFYLSSYKIGNEAAQLTELARDKKVGYVPNSLDHIEQQAREESNENDVRDLCALGIDIEVLDLQEYFGEKERLMAKIDTLGGVWVRGGNTFVLRQAMKLSGFDDIIKNLGRDDFLYGGYSAGICILSPSLKPLQIVDKADIMPYEESNEVIWDGLGILVYMILPHYKSDHPESADIDKEVEYCIRNNIPFKTLRDGEVIVIK